MKRQGIVIEVALSHKKGNHPFEFFCQGCFNIFPQCADKVNKHQSAESISYGYGAWKNTGCSVQEWTVLWKERMIRRNKLNDTREAKIRFCVEVKGMDYEEAARLFPA